MSYKDHWNVQVEAVGNGTWRAQAYDDRGHYLETVASGAPTAERACEMAKDQGFKKVKCATRPDLGRVRRRHKSLAKPR